VNQLYQKMNTKQQFTKSRINIILESHVKPNLVKDSDASIYELNNMNTYKK
jgi:hypothetical protein